MFKPSCRNGGAGPYDTTKSEPGEEYIILVQVTLHYITLHYITLHYITLHYITYKHLSIYFRQLLLLRTQLSALAQHYH